MISVRYAGRGDLEFVSQDGYVPIATIARKIEAREVVRTLVRIMGGEGAGATVVAQRRALP